MARAIPRVAILVENLYQEMEVWHPIFRFQEAGAKVTISGPEKTRYTSGGINPPTGWRWCRRSSPRVTLTLSLEWAILLGLATAWIGRRIARPAS